MILRLTTYAALLLSCFQIAAAEDAVSLFDGKTFKGWNIRKGEEVWWKVRDGVIVGGSMENKVPKNTFLATDERFQNFELRFSVRMVKGKGFANSGVQVRSIRMPNHHEMIGYQVDVGPGWWGKMYDESRRKKVIADHIDKEAMKKAIREDDWNHYKVLCEGPRIRTWINDVLAFDYTEQDKKIPLEGVIGLQAHSGGTFEVQFKDITIKKLPNTPNAPAWPKGEEKPLKTHNEQMKDASGARTPEEEMASFTLPEGFVAELVASEEQGVNKPITVQWDARGRMWTMTAVEYPIDANENQAAAEAKYEAGGRDRVLVFDNPYGPGPHTPREFTNGLVIPLGVLPTKDGAFVQYGSQIRHYHDRDDDGKAEGHEVVLDGFGIQDSHLFPHQFERAPGGWVYAAQGLFNRSMVKRPDGKPFADGTETVEFNQCKLARFKPDGSMFESLTIGPNNIWGFIQKNNGEAFLQEANDLGIPIAEYIEGSFYETGGRHGLKPYAPKVPASFKGRVMGGTGLSGLAISEDPANPFNKAYPDAENVVYVANPITNRIQIITTRRGQYGHHEYKKEEDFLIAKDTWFRPVALHFGPDGCLYIVDWYNKIISHNEVPRSHPDRDKTRGRIWRIRAVDQKSVAPPNLMEVPAKELITYLKHSNERIARFAWHAIADRQEKSLAPELHELVSKSENENVRVLAFWALEDLGELKIDWLSEIAMEAGPKLKFEITRALPGLQPSASDANKVLKYVRKESDYRVRAELANTIRRLKDVPAYLIRYAAELGDAPSHHGDRRDYDRLFERYLARWAMEEHPDATRELLSSGTDENPLSAEQRLLAINSLPPEEGAALILDMASKMERNLDQNELRLIVTQIGNDDVFQGLSTLLGSSKNPAALIDQLAKLEPELRTSPKLAVVIERVSKGILEKDSNQRSKVIDWIRLFRLSGLEGVVVDGLNKDSSKEDVIAALATLREIGSNNSKLYLSFVDHPDPDVKREVVMGLAGIPGQESLNWFSENWDELSGDLRQLAVIGMTSTKKQAALFAQSAADGKFQGLNKDQLGTLGAVLGADHPAMKAIIEKTPGMIEKVIRLTGDPQDAVITNVTLEGPFTVEAWVKLADKIGNEDNMLGRKGSLDLNFYSGQLRAYIGGNKGDLIIAKRVIGPDVWVHCAVTRDDDGYFKIYLDGVLDSKSTKTDKETYKDLNIGTTTSGKGAALRVMEFRVWDRERTADEILQNYRTSLNGQLADGLVHRVSGDSDNIQFRGKAHLEATVDFPELISREQAAEAKVIFDKRLAEVKKPGDAKRGEMHFASCLACHKVGDRGGVIGPDLSGVGAMTDEALLHNILTPNAAMESGYYRHDVLRKDGTKVTGMLAGQNKRQLSIRPIGGEVIVIPRGDILKHNVSKTSLMPEGLIDHMSAQDVADLFAYIRTLNGAN